jgi:hypothetical protein
MEPLPNGLVVLVDPSDRFVMVLDPNFCVVPVLEVALRRLLGGSAANSVTDCKRLKVPIAINVKFLGIRHLDRFLNRLSANKDPVPILPRGGQLDNERPLLSA